MERVSQPTVERGSPGFPYQGKLLYQDGDRVRGRGQARWSYYSSSTLAFCRLSSDEILYIILPSSNPSSLHPAPPCAHPCWPLSPSPRNHLPFLLPCGSFCSPVLIGIWPGIAISLPLLSPLPLAPHRSCSLSPPPPSPPLTGRGSEEDAFLQSVHCWSSLLREPEALSWGALLPISTQFFKPPH